METKDNDLELMRQQMDILNRKLEGQQIINDHLMRRAMRNQMAWIKKYVWGEVVAAPLLILLFLAFVIIFHLSWGPFILVSVMLIFSVVSDYRINMIDDRAFLSDDLSTTASRLASMKKRRIRYEIVAIPVFIVWMIWFVYDLYCHVPADGLLHDTLIGGIVGAIIGGIIGGVIGFLVVRKMQRTNDDLIRQISELTQG